MSELYHHGVKGMKWGVRRFQKKDGSLTSAGKKRYKPTDDDKEIFGEKGAQRIADRRNRGDSKRKAYAKEYGRQISKGLGLTAITTLSVYALTSGKASKAATKVINSGKNIVNKHWNIQVLDKTGKVVTRYHSKIREGRNVVEGLMRLNN